MSEIAEHIGRGNLDIEFAPVKSGDEVGKLSTAIEGRREEHPVRCYGEFCV